MDKIGGLSRRGLAVLFAAGLLALLFSRFTPAQAPNSCSVFGEDGRFHGLGLRDVDTSTLDPARRAPSIPVPESLRAVVDNSAGLPPVGDQGNQGSCGAWSVGYYIKTYMEGKEHGWGVTTPDHQFSPAYIYNQARIPDDGGMWFNDTMKLVEQLGCPTLATMPYDDADHTSWPKEGAYKEALRYRTALHNWIDTTTSGALTQVKAHVAAGNIGLLAINIWGNFDNISSYGFNYCAADRTGSNRGGHAVTIVGYDDGRVTHDGVGAFRCVNQWGTGWGDAGFFWISYQAVTDAAHRICQGWYGYMEEVSPDEPTYAARFQVTYGRFRALGVQFISGGTPYPLFDFQSYVDSMNLAVGAPPNPIWVDISRWSHPADLPIELRIHDQDTGNGVSGQIGLFELVRLEDDAKSTCTEVPVPIPSNGNTAIASAPFTFGATCSVTCAATVPATAEPGVNVPFHATASATGCAGAPFFLWSFGDGGQSDAQDATHGYAVGTYTWTLTVTADGRTCSQSGTLVIVSSCPAIEILQGPQNQTLYEGQRATLTVSATSSEALAYEWYQGESMDISHLLVISDSPSYQTEPLTTTTPYWVSVKNSCRAVFSDTAWITVTQNPCTMTCEADFFPISGDAPLTVDFFGTTTTDQCAGVVTYAWTFGDGGSSAQQFPSHTYAAAGSFTWTLTATADGKSCSQAGTVTVTGAAGKPGDCDGNGTVSIGEVQKAINMFLGIQPAGCGADCNGDGSVSIGEVQKVINAFLGLTGVC